MARVQSGRRVRAGRDSLIRNGRGRSDRPHGGVTALAEGVRLLAGTCLHTYHTTGLGGIQAKNRRKPHGKTDPKPDLSRQACQGKRVEVLAGRVAAKVTGGRHLVRDPREDENRPSLAMFRMKRRTQNDSRNVTRWDNRRRRG